MGNNKYIPPLRFHWLTNTYDWLISNLMPEKIFKTKLIENANIQENFNVLDFGTGTATLLIMAFNIQSRAKFIGIDVDEKVLHIARKKIIKQKANVELIRYEGNILPFPDNSFDRIISSLVFHHLTTEQKLASFFEFKRVLKPEGEIHIADWGKASNLTMRVMFILVQLLDGYKTTNDNVQGKLPGFLKKTGFKHVEIKEKINTVIGTIEILKVRNYE